MLKTLSLDLSLNPLLILSALQESSPNEKGKGKLDRASERYDIHLYSIVIQCNTHAKVECVILVVTNKFSLLNVNMAVMNL